MNVLTGFVLNLRPEVFDHARPYAGCKICGEIYQPDATNAVEVQQLRVKEWRVRHDASHSFAEHEMLRISGLWATPEAAYKLAPYGIIPIVDMVMNDEVKQALAEAPRSPA